MQVNPTANEVRQIVCRIFTELGLGTQDIDDMSETVLVEEGQIRARSYRTVDMMAMWLVEIGIVQFYDAEGNLVQRTNLLANIRPRQMAA